MSHEHRREDDPITPPPGMTREQLRFFAAEAERAADKGSRQGIKAYRKQATVGFVILLLGVGFNTYQGEQDRQARERVAIEAREAIVSSGRVVAVDGCNRDYADRVKFRNLLIRLKAASAASPDSTPQQRERALQFYNGELRNYPLTDCRRAQQIITDNPDNIPRNPDPYYPGNPRAPKEIDPSEAGG